MFWTIFGAILAAAAVLAVIAFVLANEEIKRWWQIAHQREERRDANVVRRQEWERQLDQRLQVIIELLGESPRQRRDRWSTRQVLEEIESEEERKWGLLQTLRRRAHELKRNQEILREGNEGWERHQLALRMWEELEEWAARQPQQEQQRRRVEGGSAP